MGDLGSDNLNISECISTLVVPRHIETRKPWDFAECAPYVEAA